MRVLKKLFVWIIVCCVMLIAALLAVIQYLPGKYYNSYLEKIILDTARANHINLSISDLKLNLFGIQAKQVDAYLGILPLKLDNPIFQFSPISLLSKLRTFKIASDLYDGHLSINCELDIDNLSGTTSASLQAINLNALLGWLGIKTGLLSAKIDNAQLQSGQINSALISFDVKNYSGLIPSFTIRSQQGPLKISLPNVNNLDLEFAGTLAEQKLTILQAKADSTFGKATLSGQFFLKSTEKDALLKLQANIELSPQGSQAIGSYLPALSNNTLDSSASKFNIDISGKPNNPQIFFSRTE